MPNGQLDTLGSPTPISISGSMRCVISYTHTPVLFAHGVIVVRTLQ
jgi:hypothetical protein